MPDHRYIIGNVSITHGSYASQHWQQHRNSRIFRCILIHKAIDDPTYKCISATDTIKNVEGQALAFVSLLPFNQRYAIRLFSLQNAGKTDNIRCNAFYIRISVRKCPEHFFRCSKSG